MHAFLDSGKAPLDLVEDRAAYYERVIPAIFEAVGIDTSRLRVVRGSSYQSKGNFFTDVLRLSSQVTAKKAKKAGAEVVKQDEDSLVSSSLYPLMQALDEEYLGVDAQFGGMDQRKLFMAAAEWLPKLGYQKVGYCSGELTLRTVADQKPTACPPHEPDSPRPARQEDELQ